MPAVTPPLGVAAAVRGHHARGDAGGRRRRKQPQRGRVAAVDDHAGLVGCFVKIERPLGADHLAVRVEQLDEVLGRIDTGERELPVGVERHRRGDLSLPGFRARTEHFVYGFFASFRCPADRARHPGCAGTERLRASCRSPAPPRDRKATVCRVFITCFLPNPAEMRRSHPLPTSPGGQGTAGGYCIGANDGCIRGIHQAPPRGRIRLSRRILRYRFVRWTPSTRAARQSGHAGAAEPRRCSRARTGRGPGAGSRPPGSD